ncbi:MAG: hypothetical protein ACK559_40925, partial [bacterium]
MDYGHAKDTDRGTKILDVECCSKRLLELLGPCRVTAENQQVLNIYCNEHHQSGGDQRVAGA